MSYNIYASSMVVHSKEYFSHLCDWKAIIIMLREISLYQLCCRIIRFVVLSMMLLILSFRYADETKRVVFLYLLEYQRSMKLT